MQACAAGRQAPGRPGLGASGQRSMSGGTGQHAASQAQASAERPRPVRPPLGASPGWAGPWGSRCSGGRPTASPGRTGCRPQSPTGRSTEDGAWGAGWGSRGGGGGARPSTLKSGDRVAGRCAAAGKRWQAGGSPAAAVLACCLPRTSPVWPRGHTRLACCLPASAGCARRGPSGCTLPAALPTLSVSSSKSRYNDSLQARSRPYE